MILPRELNIDELRACSETCPQELNLEVFVHGALCYCVSGALLLVQLSGGQIGPQGPLRAALPPGVQAKGAGGALFFPARICPWTC